MFLKVEPWRSNLQKKKDTSTLADSSSTSGWEECRRPFSLLDNCLFKTTRNQQPVAGWNFQREWKRGREELIGTWKWELSVGSSVGS